MSKPNPRAFAKEGYFEFPYSDLDGEGTYEGEIYFLSALEIEQDELTDDDGDDPLEEGWYFSFGAPGYMFDSGPYGPYRTSTDAWEAARDDD